MPRFYYEYCDMDDDTWDYCVFDRRRGSDTYLAICATATDAEKIVEALNGYKKPDAGIFG